MMQRSLLFVPADDRRKFDKAAAGSADALVLDLEDSVSDANKPGARDTVRGMLAAGAPGKALWVRINPLDTRWALDDLHAVVAARPFGIVLPKARGGADVAHLAHYLDAFETAGGIPNESRLRILPIVTEVSSAVFKLDTYAGCSPRLWGLTWGGEDLAADLGTRVNRRSGRYSELFRAVRSACLLAAASAGVRAIDTVAVELDDEALLARESTEAWEDGFVGKTAIHPRQVEPINRAFTPGDAECDFARRIVEAFERDPGLGTFRLDGKMIDRPHLRAALRTLGREA